MLWSCMVVSWELLKNAWEMAQSKNNQRNYFPLKSLKCRLVGFVVMPWHLVNIAQMSWSTTRLSNPCMLWFVSLSECDITEFPFFWMQEPVTLLDYSMNSVTEGIDAIATTRVVIRGDNSYLSTNASTGEEVQRTFRYAFSSLSFKVIKLSYYLLNFFNFAHLVVCWYKFSKFVSTFLFKLEKIPNFLRWSFLFRFLPMTI